MTLHPADVDEGSSASPITKCELGDTQLSCALGQDTNISTCAGACRPFPAVAWGVADREVFACSSAFER
jgi:hypothetical protein